MRTLRPRSLGRVALIAGTLIATTASAQDGAAPATTTDAASPAPTQPGPTSTTTSPRLTGEPVDDAVMRYPPSSVRFGLIGGGLAIAGGAYAASAISASQWPEVPGSDSMYIPVVGPWMALGQNDCASDDPDCGAIVHIRGILLVLDGLAQIGGLGLVGEGIFMTTEADDPGPPATSWSLVPTASPTQTGVALSGTF